MSFQMFKSEIISLSFCNYYDTSCVAQNSMGVQCDKES